MTTRSVVKDDVDGGATRGSGSGGDVGGMGGGHGEGCGGSELGDGLQRPTVQQRRGEDAAGQQHRAGEALRRGFRCD